VSTLKAADCGLEKYPKWLKQVWNSEFKPQCLSPKYI
jgi:hypothetical protein